MNATIELTLPVQKVRVTMRTRVLGSDRSESLAASLDGAPDDQPARRYILASEALAACLVTEWEAKDPETGGNLPITVEGLRKLDADDYECLVLEANKLREGRPEEADIPFGSASPPGSKATKSRPRQ